jgi:hypothetical protein
MTSLLLAEYRSELFPGEAFEVRRRRSTFKKPLALFPSTTCKSLKAAHSTLPESLNIQAASRGLYSQNCLYLRSLA